MKSKDYREIQLSSSHLVFIFIGILILGVVIFLLGVSVGKKQAQIAQESGISAQAKIEEVKKKSITPPQESQDVISKELASHQKIKEESQRQKPAEEKENLYYIQVGAFKNKNAAHSLADSYRNRGHPAVVLDPFPSDKIPFYRVRIGGFPTREEAESHRQNLAQSEEKKQSDYLIVRK